TQAVVGIDKHGTFTIGMIGIMNAMVTDGRIAAIVTDDGKSVSKFVVFNPSNH
ncbi:hypothetical protein RSE67_004691, partial [Yersinia enterocolitica]|nr:hypothetical protein [Yersinia enterocolitica]